MRDYGPPSLSWHVKKISKNPFKNPLGFVMPTGERSETRESMHVTTHHVT